MNQIDQLEQQLADAKELAARRALALKLSGNREFKKLILEDFCVDEAARLVSISGDPSLDPAQRQDAIAMAQAGGHLKRFLNAIDQMGKVQERDIPQIEEALTEARAETDGEEA